MKKTRDLVLILASMFLTLVAIVVTISRTATGQNVGQGTFPESIWSYSTSTKIWVGTSVVTNLYTTVAPASNGRTYLEITNLSGATSTPQAIYCKVGENPVKYEGIVIQASSTRTWEKSHVPVGAVKCIFPVSSSTVAVVER